LLSTQHFSAVDIRAMDDQHGILMDTLNELRLVALRGHNREEVSQLLKQLIDFTRMHFASEEQLMEQFDYPGLVEHRAEHHRLLLQIQESANKLLHSESMHMRPLLGFLNDCYQEHIDGADKEYGPWLNTRGVF
jgi:hemerythrin-like metal-binding protein